VITRKSKKEMEIMHQAGKVVAAVHAYCRENAKPGVSTWELDQGSEAIIREAGGLPTFKGYHGFPATICASINDEIVHGIPSKKRLLREGDIFSLDVGCTLKGLVADAAVTVAVGTISKELENLLIDTEKSLFLGIEAARVGNRIHDIGAAIETFANQKGYGIVRDYGGHGVGHQLHEEPHIPNHGRAGSGPRIKAGHCFAIEPMLNLGTDDVRVLPDEWTVVTADSKPSAHFEHSIAITEEGPFIFTLPKGVPQPFTNSF
jgi:methionyl aminopeptidase